MEYLITLLEKLSESIPLPIYVTIGGLVEEVIAPIPSPLVMTSAGSIAEQQGQTIMYLAFISLLAAFGKTIGAVIIYVFADKAEDLLLTRFGKFLGITHKEIESFGKKFNNTWKDDVLLVILRAVPIFPGAPVAAVAGLIKLNMRTYIQSTFIGVWIRSMIFAVIGFYGMSQLNHYIAGAEGFGNLIFLIIVGVPFLYYVYKNKERLQDHALDMLKKINK